MRWPKRTGLILFSLSYWLIASLLHLRISLFLVTSHTTPLGRIRPADYSAYLGGALLLVLGVWLLERTIRRPPRLQRLLQWGTVLAAVWATDRLLIQSANEYIHFPQYGFLAMLLVSVCDPDLNTRPMGKIIFWTTLLGIGDELIQYLVLCPEYVNYLDFNDFFLNQLGAVMGVLIRYDTHWHGRTRFHSGSWRNGVPEALLVLILALLVLVALLSGRLRTTTSELIPPGGVATVNGKMVLFLERSPGSYGSWLNKSNTGTYYVLPPLWGLLLVGTVGTAVSLSHRITMRPRTPV